MDNFTMIFTHCDGTLYLVANLDMETGHREVIDCSLLSTIECRFEERLMASMKKLKRFGLM